MKTSSEAIDDVIGFLANALLLNSEKKPNGIISTEQLDNSKSEDIIVNSLPLMFRQIQRGVLNVNIFVPNVEIPKANKEFDRSQRNRVRLGEIERLVIDSFDETGCYDGFDFSLRLQQINTFPDTGNKHFINCRIEYLAINLQGVVLLPPPADGSNFPIIITQQPVAQNWHTGDTFFLEVDFIGEGTVTWRGSDDGGLTFPYLNGTGKSFTHANTGPFDNGTYRAEILYSGGIVFSDAVTVVVLP